MRGLEFVCHMASLQFLATLVGIGICSALHGQGKWGIRLNQNTDFFPVTYTVSNASSYTEREVRAGRISAVFSYLRGKYTHELELFVPQVNSSDPIFPWPYAVRSMPTYKIKYSSYAIRYTISRNVYSFTKSFSLSLGGGLNGYILKVKNVPQVENSFPVSDYMVGMSLNAVPGINLQASRHLSFVLDCPLKVFDFYYRTVNIQNPLIPPRQQKKRSFETDDFMKALTVRLGVAYKFGG